MKKTLAILLALVVVGGAAFAQIAVTATASGSVYIENARGDGNIVSSLSPNGAGYDVLKFAAADKDNKYGIAFYDNALMSGSITPDFWNIWYDLGFAKVTMGVMDGGSYKVTFVNGWLENYDPADTISKGFLVESKDFGGLKVAAFMPLPSAVSPALFVETATDAKNAVIAASYAIADVVTIKAQSNLAIADEATDVNVGFDFTGVAGLDAYGWANYTQGGDMAGGIGAQYKTDTYRVGAEFEAQDASDVLAYDAVVNARYYVTPALFVQARAAYLNKNTEYGNSATVTTSTATYDDARIWAKGYVNYAFGNGFAVEGMVGYDTLPVANYQTYDASLVHYVRFTYSVAF